MQCYIFNISEQCELYLNAWLTSFSCRALENMKENMKENTIMPGTLVMWYGWRTLMHPLLKREDMKGIHGFQDLLVFPLDHPALYLPVRGAENSVYKAIQQK